MYKYWWDFKTQHTFFWHLPKIDTLHWNSNSPSTVRLCILCLNFDTLILLNVCSQSLKALSVFEFRLLWWILNWVAVFIVAAKDKPLQCIFGGFFLQSDIVSLILKKNKKRIEKYTLAQQKNPRDIHMKCSKQFKWNS